MERILIDLFSPQTLLGLVILLLLALRWWWDVRREIREQASQYEPRSEPPLHKLYVTREDHRQLERAFKDFADKVDERFEKLSSTAAASREKVYARLNELDKTQAGVVEVTRSISQQIVGMRNQIATLLKEVGRHQ